MPFPTTMHVLLGLFLQGVDPPATNLSAPTPPVRSPKSSSLQEISVAGAGNRAQWVGRAAVRARGRKGGEELEREEVTGTQRDGHAAR